MIYSREQLQDMKLFPRNSLIDLIMIMQESDRRIFAATILGSMLQSDPLSPMNLLITEAVATADLLIEELNG